MTDTQRSWLLELGITYDPRLTIVSTSDTTGTRYILANDSIPANSTVAAIPKTSILSPQNSSLAPHLAKLVPGLSPSVLLSLCLLYEKCLEEKSRWKAYINSLPEKDTVAIGALWSKKFESGTGLARCWSSGTDLELELNRLEIDPILLESIYNTHITPFLGSSPFLIPSTQTQPTFPLFLWAYSIVSSRAFLVDSFHSLSLVPFADLFNHADSHDVHLASENWVCAECGSFEECLHDESSSEWRKEQVGKGSARGLGGTKTLKEEIQLHSSINPTTVASNADSNCEMITVTSITAGQEVFNTYGPGLSNAKLIASYGFALEANPHDICTFTLPALLQDSTINLSLDEVTIFSKESRLLAKRWGKSSVSPLVIPYDPTPSSLTRENLFHLDADARLSLPFFIFLSLLHLQDLIPTLDPPHSDQTYFYLRRLDSILASLVSGMEEGEREGFAKLGEKDQEAIGALVRGVERGCEARRKGYWESEMKGAEVFEWADKVEDPAVKLAMEFAATERLLMACVSSSWKELLTIEDST